MNNCTFNDDGSATIFGDEYSFEEMEYFVYDSIVPAYCTTCKEHVGDYEPDLEHGKHRLSEGGCGKQTVHSLLVLVGIM